MLGQFSLASLSHRRVSPASHAVPPSLTASHAAMAPYRTPLVLSHVNKVFFSANSAAAAGGHDGGASARRPPPPPPRPPTNPAPGAGPTGAGAGAIPPPPVPIAHAQAQSAASAAAPSAAAAAEGAAAPKTGPGAGAGGAAGSGSGARAPPASRSLLVPAPWTKGRIFGTIFFTGTSLVTMALCAWQVKRYFWKKELIEQRTSSLSLPPIPLEEHMTALAADAWDRLASTFTTFRTRSLHATLHDAPPRPVTLRGRFDYSREQLIGPAAPPLDTQNVKKSDVARGYYVFTPLTLSTPLDVSAPLRPTFPFSGTNDSPGAVGSSSTRFNDVYRRNAAVNALRHAHAAAVAAAEAAGTPPPPAPTPEEEEAARTSAVPPLPVTSALYRAFPPSTPSAALTSSPLVARAAAAEVLVNRGWIPVTMAASYLKSSRLPERTGESASAAVDVAGEGDVEITGAFWFGAHAQDSTPPSLTRIKDTQTLAHQLPYPHPIATAAAVPPLALTPDTPPLPEAAAAVAAAIAAADAAGVPTDGPSSAAAAVATAAAVAAKAAAAPEDATLAAYSAAVATSAAAMAAADQSPAALAVVAAEEAAPALACSDFLARALRRTEMRLTRLGRAVAAAALAQERTMAEKEGRDPAEVPVVPNLTPQEAALGDGIKEKPTQIVKELSAVMLHTPGSADAAAADAAAANAAAAAAAAANAAAAAASRGNRAAIDAANAAEAQRTAATVNTIVAASLAASAAAPLPPPPVGPPAATVPALAAAAAAMEASDLSPARAAAEDKMIWNGAWFDEKAGAGARGEPGAGCSVPGKWHPYLLYPVVDVMGEPGPSQRIVAVDAELSPATTVRAQLVRKTAADYTNWHSQPSTHIVYAGTWGTLTALGFYMAATRFWFKKVPNPAMFKSMSSSMRK